MESSFQDLFNSLHKPRDTSVGVADLYYVTEDNIPAASDDECLYEEIPIELYTTSDEEEDFSRANSAILERKRNSEFGEFTQNKLTFTLPRRPEIVEDFVKNFLAEVGMSKTLGTFQTEWYQLNQINKTDVRQQPLPDCYSHNRILARRIGEQLKELDRQRNVGVRAGEALVRLRKERDFHRMHHNRLVQEKQRLLHDLNTLKQHYSSFPTALSHLKDRYESAIRESTLSHLERERAMCQVVSLQATLKSLHGITNCLPTGPLTRSTSKLIVENRLIEDTIAKPGISELNRNINYGIGTTMNHLVSTTNPFADKEFAPCGHLTKAVGFHLTRKVKSHSYGISDVNFHPNKPFIVTGSDDHTWKLWSLPELKLLMSGEGHHDWISSCRFHPLGHRLATGSGDGSIKIWDFSKGSCIQTLNDHTHGIWATSWHWSGESIVSGSQDHHIKIWDITSGTCLSTLREHFQAVTCVQYLPYSHLFISCSADKRVALWDCRNGLCVHTFLGHTQSVNWCCADIHGKQLASCDAFGQVNLWDLRQHRLTETVDLGPHMANRIEFDMGSACFGVAMGNGVIQMYNLAQRTRSELSEHEESVQCLAFKQDGEYIVSGCSEGSLYLWS